MKDQLDLLLKIQKLEKFYHTHPPEAYSFVLRALDHTMKKLPKPRHISGQELLEGIREYALKEFGPMAGMVLKHWNIKNTLGFGQIVFDLIEVGLLRKREEDVLDDFKNGFDFKEAFKRKFEFGDSD